MIAINIEASHSKGMGHLFRMLNFAAFLDSKSEKYIFFINDNDKTKEILKLENINFIVVDCKDVESNWENTVIQKYNIKYWINDRLDTDILHSKNVKKENILLINFDDLGSGSELCDINVCGLFFNKSGLRGKNILKGINYLILNNQIDFYKRERKEIKKILVTLGGSDTYGVTIKVLELLKKHKIKATIHVGPSFQDTEKLQELICSDYEVINFVPSMIEEFFKYDLAITGGGVTPFEANAAGLVCLIIANELFEIQNGEYLDSIGASKFLGYYKDIDERLFSNLNSLDIVTMSKNGINQLNTMGAEKIYKEIMKNE